jgi:4-diphosphocytidyl-2-C-methyl-D-erythritol kinase
MISFPHCKINLGLYITAKRQDGYHDLDTVFYPVPIHDILEFVEAPEPSFHLTGLPIMGVAADNLCQKAYRLLKTKHPSLPSIEIHLHKLIPMGAGLGGGSADGAFMLSMLNKHFRLDHSQEELMAMALELGSDCPFFILDKPAHGLGRGEILKPIPLSLSSWWLALVNPGIHVSTKEAFSNVSPKPAPVDLARKILEPVESWKNWLHNDFEDSVCKIHPEISTIKDSLYTQGAAHASMTGTGSTVYGLFREQPSLQLPSNYLVKTVQLK